MSGCRHPPRRCAHGSRRRFLLTTEITVDVQQRSCPPDATTKDLCQPLGFNLVPLSARDKVETVHGFLSKAAPA